MPFRWYSIPSMAFPFLYGSALIERSACSIVQRAEDRERYRAQMSGTKTLQGYMPLSGSGPALQVDTPIKAAPRGSVKNDDFQVAKQV